MEKEKEEQKMEEYISQLSEVEKIAYEIAKEHLVSSFNIRRSNGFKEWLKKK
jgi:hypothetical protein